MARFIPQRRKSPAASWRPAMRRMPGVASARRLPAIAMILGLAASCAGHAFGNPRAPAKFWNMTAATITQLYMAPAGTKTWSANLCLSDPDHAVDPDERLAMTGVAGGLYDVRVVDKDGRQCMFHGVTVRPNGPYAFSVSEDQMKGCGGR